MKLDQLQSEFWQMVTQPTHARSQHEASRVFEGSATFSPARRIGVYVDMFLWRQVDCLREDFPKLAALHPNFFELARDYLKQQPSNHHSLSKLGHALPDFLNTQPLPRTDLADLAALEWARTEIVEEADASILIEPTFGPPRFIPALRRLQLQHDVLAVWAALDADLPASEPRRVPTAVVVWRREFAIFHVALDAAEAVAFDRAVEGAELEAICAAFEEQPDPVAAAYRAIGSWFAEGWIATTSPRNRP